ncbi:flp pilus-assembly TadE/G-like family protein [Salinibacterium sp. SYSU T00001]|uniref:Rv3654c family TadE-like protein n=1 Tax=Homoserinimonas sedimenticola TaxID=2986805 RepID=UPI002235D766|nr:Rv3654c family TadE-like protein [Salinibacterium sedimenticola]MCW4385164.1 flp pilus-assembly TadE/G-like family protein [Salinibacterium sedimenticola]
MNERGSGSVLVVGILAVVMGVALLCAPLVAARLDSSRAATAADAAALAAADTAVGIVPGSPCANAARTAEANGASLDACRVEGLVVTVAVSRASGPLRATATATAGPPGTTP